MSTSRFARPRLSQHLKCAFDGFVGESLHDPFEVKIFESLKLETRKVEFMRHMKLLSKQIRRTYGREGRVAPPRRRSFAGKVLRFPLQRPLWAYAMNSVACSELNFGGRRATFPHINHLQRRPKGTYIFQT